MNYGMDVAPELIGYELSAATVTNYYRVTPKFQGKWRENG